MKSKIFVAFIFLFAVIAVMGGVLINFFVENRKMKRTDTPPIVYERLNSENSFLDANFLSARESRGVFSDTINKMVRQGERFIAVDLKEMKLALYEDGIVKQEFPVLSKGRDGSWWETPTGSYTVLQKEKNHFSSIGKVWMPWSIQFYGNFFIHGWPYYPDGTPVPESYSGGCVRLSSEDAEAVYAFAKVGTPVVVFDEESKPAYRPALASTGSVLPPPRITASSALIADLDTGEIYLNKNGDDALPIASLTKLMTAVVVSELVYLERSVTLTPSMLTGLQSYPFVAGKRYRAFDLLYPALQLSSNGAASALAAFLGEKTFVRRMNDKAVSLGMEDTYFEDSTGIGDGNISTVKDLAKLAKYILEKRRFIFDITRGKNYSIFGPNEFTDIENHNEFYDDKRVIGVKNGYTKTALETMLTVWQLRREGLERNIVIVILGSFDREKDTLELLGWLKENFGLQ